LPSTILQGIGSLTNNVINNIKDVFNAVIQLPSQIVTGLKDAFVYLFVPQQPLSGWESLQQTLKSKLPAFFGAIELIEGIDKTVSDETPLKWEVTLPLIDKKVSIMDFQLLQNLISVQRALCSGLLWYWFIVFLMNNFDVKFHIG
jgi:hypothetical protein